MPEVMDLITYYFGIAFSIAGWMALDRQISHGDAITTGVFWPVAVPIWIYDSRRNRLRLIEDEARARRHAQKRRSSSSVGTLD